MLPRIVALFFAGISIIFFLMGKKEQKLWKRNAGFLFILLALMVTLGGYGFCKIGRIYPTLEKAFSASCTGTFAGGIDGKDSSIIAYMDNDNNYDVAFLRQEDEGYSVVDRDIQHTLKYGSEGSISALIMNIEGSCDQYLVVVGLSNGVEIAITADQVSDLQIYKELPVIPVNSAKFIAIGLLDTSSSLEQVIVGSESSTAIIELTDG